MGRPREFCRRACRQRDYEARRRAAELGLGEHELVVARAELDRLYDELYVLEATLDDVDRDLVGARTVRDHRLIIDELLAAARPLAGRRLDARA